MTTDNDFLVNMGAHGMRLHSELRAEFAAITAGMANWKERIDARVIVSGPMEAAFLGDVVTFFTGSVARVVVVRATPRGAVVRITAAGYFAVCGA